MSGDFVKINVSNSMNDLISFEKRFPKDLTILEFKEKLEIVTGGSAASMKLELFTGDRFICKIDNNDALLGSYPIDDDMRIHVTDTVLYIAEQVEKFELTEQQYDQRQDSLKSFLKNNKLGKYNEEEMKKIEEKKKQVAEEERKKAESCTVGSRCKVQVKGKPTRLGTIMYNGELEGKKAIFIGVKYDEPLGTNNGTVDGKCYFKCEDKYGGFVAPGCVEVGDFPPVEDELDEI